MGFQIRWAKTYKCNLVLEYQLPHKINVVNKDNTKNLYAMTKSKLILKLEKNILPNTLEQILLENGGKTGIKEWKQRDEL